MAGFCTNCGQPLVEGAAFCTNCGHKVVPLMENMDPAPAGQQAPASQPQTGNIAFNKPEQPPQVAWQSQPPAQAPQAGPGSNATPGFWLKLRREKQWYLINPAIDVSIDQGQPFGLENGQEIVLQISPGPHHLHLSCTMRSHDLDIYVQSNMCVHVSWNRLFGNLETEVQPF